MAVSYPTVSVRNGVTDYIVDLLDAGVGAGNLVFRTSGDAEVATLAFSATAFGASAAGTATANAISDDTSATGGTTTKASLEDGDGNIILECSVGTSGEDINLNNNVIGAGVTVSVSSLTYATPAS